MSDSDDHRRQLVEGATNEAGRRLGAVRDDIISAVTSFQSEAHDAAEDLKGKSESDTGLALFKILLDVAIAAIPGAEEAKVAIQIASEVGKEAVKGFTEAFAEGVHKSEADSAKERLDEAKAELRRIATKLSKDALDSARNAYNRAEPLLAHSAEQVLEAHPDLAGLDLDQDNYNTLATRMGWVEPGKSQLADRLSSALMKQFQAEMKRVKADLDFHDMDSDAERLEMLVRKEATMPAGEFKSIRDYLAFLGADVPWWLARTALYEQTFGNSDPPTLRRAMAVLEAAHDDDATPETVKTMMMTIPLAFDNM